MRLVKSWFSILILTLLLTSCTSAGAKTTPTLVPTPVTVEKPVYTVQRGTVTSTVQLTGRVTPIQQQDLFFRSDGIVKEVLVQAGDPVQVGDVLARLDEPEQYQANAAAAELAYIQAQRNLEQVTLNSPIKLAEAKQALIATRRALDLATINLNWAKGNLTQAGIDQAQVALDLAQGNYDKAAAELQRCETDSQTSDLAMAKLTLADAEARFAMAKKAQEAVELRAPFAGQVLSLGIAPGSSIKAFQAVVTLADPAKLEIRAIPSTEDLTRLGIGQVAIVRLSSQAGMEWTARITNVPMLTNTASSGAGLDTSVHLRLDDVNATLALGDAATVLVTIDTRENVLWLPPAALRQFQGESFVFVEIGGVQRRVNVTLGVQSADRVEIVSGLEEGQTVVGQ